MAVVEGRGRGLVCLARCRVINYLQRYVSCGKVMQVNSTRYREAVSFQFCYSRAFSFSKMKTTLFCFVLWNETAGRNLRGYGLFLHTIVKPRPCAYICMH